MNIGDKVVVNLIMEVEAIKRDAFSQEILIEGKILAEERGHFFTTVPQRSCKLVETAHVV